VPLYTKEAVEAGSLSSRAVDALLELGESLFFSWLWDKPSPRDRHIRVHCAGKGELVAERFRSRRSSAR
jgi:hypothetical protein